MKTIKLLFAILFLSTMFIACEADAVNDEIGIEINDTIGEEDENDGTVPNDTKANEDENDGTVPGDRKASEDENESTTPEN